MCRVYISIAIFIISGLIVWRIVSTDNESNSIEEIIVQTGREVINKK